MKKTLISMAALLVALVGCNKEPQQGGVEDPSKDAVYMSFRVSTVETRSSTDDGTSTANPDTEVGTEDENKIQHIDLLLVKLDGTTETTTVVRADNVQASEAQEDVYVATFNQNDNNVVLEEANYNVYIYANADANETFNKVTDKTTASDAVLTAEGGIAEAGKFFMTSSSVKPVSVANLDAHTTPADPLDLGVYEVQRAAARFDIAKNLEFVMVENDQSTNDVNEQVKLTVTHVALINAGKEFYDFKRVTSTVTEGVPSNTSTDWNVLGLETSNNWVVDSEWGAATPSFFYPMAVNNEDSYNWKAISELTTPDNWTAGTPGEKEPIPASEYYPWTYAVENTLQGISAQKKGVTTGVVFRAKIEGDLVTAADKAPIYVFGNVLYGTWAQMKAKAEAKGSTLYALQAAINEVEAKGANVTAADYAAAGFTGYSYDATLGGYYATYYYWNRHNDNGNNDVMGIMEFAVVRNNVYKLAITEIAKYGHPYNTDPNNPNPDPDPENPEDPDESVNYYFTVSVKVLPWVVRVNHIEF